MQLFPCSTISTPTERIRSGLKEEKERRRNEKSKEELQMKGRRTTLNT